MKIEIKHRISGEVLFSHEQEGNSWRVTVELAIKSHADLRHADLRHADLRHANLRHANLRHADLYDADLRHADLRHADLYDADLYDADLRHANLRHANLRHADLRHADLRHADLLCFGDMKFIFTMQLDKWPIGFTEDILQIGCKKHLIEEWRNFSDEKIDEMDSNALLWWKKWKDFIFTAIEKTIGEQK